MKNKKYLSGLITDVHLHAGENLFGLIYKNSLEFKDDNQVVFGRIVVDPFRPLDESDIEFLNQFKITGSYYFNEAGYLICEFEEVFWKFTGMVSPNNGNLLAFSAYDSRLSRHWSEVYEFDSDVNCKK